MLTRADRARPRAPSIAWRIFWLVVASVLAVAAVLFAVTFRGPPPRMAPLAIEDFADALNGRPVVPMRHDRWHGGPPPFGRPRAVEPLPADALIHSVSPTPPRPRSDEHADPARAAALARVLGAAPGEVVAFVSDQPPGMRLLTVNGATVGWRQADGWHVARTTPPPFFTRWHLVTLGAMLATLAMLSVIACGIARAISRPIEQLAAAADAAQAGAALPTLPRRGPAEVLTLTQAVGAMHARLAGHAEGRTAMLAAIAHDLGTPLSRLAFRIEELPEPHRGRAAADIEEMRAMIADTLRFARDEAGERDGSRVDLGSLLDSLAEDMREGGAAVALHPGPRAVVRGDPRALRRLFANLVGNAVRYGERARIGWTVADGAALVGIEDDGPGVDPAQAERLFEPFVRGDPSRNRATGGTGLGLAIVRSIAARHGGSATLGNRPEGGARAQVILPLAPALGEVA